MRSLWQQLHVLICTCKTKYVSGQDLVSAACVILSSDGPNLRMAHLGIERPFKHVLMILFKELQYFREDIAFLNN